MGKKLLLVVEDDLSLMKALSGKLTGEGFEVIEAKNGEEGLKKALEHKPELTLLDIVMPRMDGLTMLKQLRKDEWGKDAKVIILTNLSDAANANELEEKGVSDYLIKSDWSLEDIVKKVQDTLK